VGPGLSNAHLPEPGGVAWGENKAGKVVIFRPFEQGDWSYVKIKGELAWELYRGMTRAEPNEKDTRRRGQNMLGSLDNVVDGPVVELRLANRTRRLGGYGKDFELEHSLVPNRERGQATREGDTLVFTGDAATALNTWLGRKGARVVFDIVALDRGELKLRD
jgi:hypothetical protein